MREIYYKEGEHINSKSKYITNYINEGNPTTLYKDTGFIQCREGRARSFEELFWLFKSRFKTATKGELSRILLDNNNSNIGTVACPSVNKLTVYNRNRQREWPSYTNNGRHVCSYGRLSSTTIKHGPQFYDILKYATRKKDFTLNKTYKLLFEQERNYIDHCKNLKKQFINFLKDNDAYSKFTSNLKLRNNGDFNNFIKSNKTNPVSWISLAFTWINTPEGEDFWLILNNNWQRFVIQ